ncbi:MAG: aldo/keto reductase [Okeania sp. SIO2C2]|uniref:aldo/keto reductase n=1 Tax=Okeania sp. SIO2C2 TaxID=2607787 RepID=UPI0013B8A890|nr:aldo/keto reductase [Okeania sp. SIO2C2]NEP88971.1 aldo/keto reductase [Okeania sp. SIO2C2]
MATTTLGKTGITVNPICIGTWAWGDKFFWNYGSNYGANEVEAAFQTSLEAGINFFDTAEVYGNGLSEELLGKFMQKTEQTVQIATKYGPVPWRFFPESVADAVTASLKRLMLPKVTLYQVHWPFTFFMSQETLLNALADEVKQGRVEAVGVSNYSAEEMRQAHAILEKRGVILATNQVRYSLLSRQIEAKGILDTAKELGVTILAYSPLAQGLLTGKYTVEKPPTGARQFDSRFQRKGLEKITPVMSLLKQIGEKYDKTLAQVALNWLVFQDSVIPIAGCKNSEQVRQNVGAIGWEMSQEEFNQLEEITRPWLK